MFSSTKFNYGRPSMAQKLGVHYTRAMYLKFFFFPQNFSDVLYMESAYTLVYAVRFAFIFSFTFTFWFMIYVVEKGINLQYIYIPNVERIIDKIISWRN